ncbi:hypothetical protein Q7P37_005359 [Cladosporium fusiforme]
MQDSSLRWKVRGGLELSGSITTNGSKNSALAILCASLLTTEPITLSNVPHISDVVDMVSILQSIGSTITWQNKNTLTLERPFSVNLSALDLQAARRARTVMLLAGGIALDHETFSLPSPGGCQLGDRSLEPHIDALEQLGLQLTRQFNEIRVRRLSEHNSTDFTVTLLESGDTVTENAILTAVAMRKHTVHIQNASCNYMVQDLCQFLQSLEGVYIQGIGSPSLTVRRCISQAPGPISFTILEDPIESFFFIAAAIMAKSNVHLKRVPFCFISLELRLLAKMGLHVIESPHYPSASGTTTLCDLRVMARGCSLTAPRLKLHPNIYPFGINVDNLPAFGAIAAVSNGETLLHDWMYEQRAPYFALLEVFGVEVQLLDTHRARIIGSSELQPAICRLPPALRPASMLFLVALGAPGNSQLENVDVLRRGYEDLIGRLGVLGARIDAFASDEEVRSDFQASERAIRSVI